jgi:hypothetical protein
MKLYTNGNTYKYALKIGRLWVYWRPIKETKKKFIIQYIQG